MQALSSFPLPLPAPVAAALAASAFRAPAPPWPVAGPAPQAASSLRAAPAALANPAAHGLPALALALLDEIDCGLVVCDAAGRVRFANRAARRELAAGRRLARHDGRLVRVLPSGARPGPGAELEAALRAAAFRGRRSLVALAGDGDDEYRLLVSVQPLPAAAAEPGDAEAGVLLLFGRRRACSALGMELLASAHRLTQAERRVLAGLLDEAAPGDIARRHGVRLSTVRTQIQSIRAKFGVHSIEALLLRAAEVPPVASALTGTPAEACAPAAEPALRAAA